MVPCQHCCRIVGEWTDAIILARDSVNDYVTSFGRGILRDQLAGTTQWQPSTL